MSEMFTDRLTGLHKYSPQKCRSRLWIRFSDQRGNLQIYWGLWEFLWLCFLSPLPATWRHSWSGQTEKIRGSHVLVLRPTGTKKMGQRISPSKVLSQYVNVGFFSQYLIREQTKHNCKCDEEVKGFKTYNLNDPSISQDASNWTHYSEYGMQTDHYKT